MQVLSLVETRANRLQLVMRNKLENTGDDIRSLDQRFHRIIEFGISLDAGAQNVKAWASPQLRI